MNNLKQKFQGLTEREQWLVIASAVVVVIGVFYWVVWSPLNSSLETNRTAVKAKQSDLIWVRKQATKAIQLKGAGNQTTSFTGSLTQVVNQTAGRLRIAVSRMQPQGDDLKVWVDQAPFNDVLSWLQALESRGVRIIDVDFAQADAPGHIKIRSLKLGKS